MKRLFVAVLPLGTLLAGCGVSVDQLSKAADSARNATEQMAVASADASAARENKIMADARDLAATQAAQAGLDTGERPRYEIRKDQDGWTVYDTVNNRPARVGPKNQSGLSRAEAESAFTALAADERRSQQQFTPGGDYSDPTPTPQP